MAAALAVILLKIRSRGNVVEIENVPLGIKSSLRKNNFLLNYGFPPLLDRSQTALPFICFDLAEEKKFSDYLDKHLLGKGVPKMTSELEKRFRQSIFELFVNCAMHSKSNDGILFCGQFFQKSGHLDLTISDVGVGIRNNVRTVMGANYSSIDAIAWALEEGNTTKTGTQPGGFGLKLLREFVELNDGMVQIVSRYGYYELNSKDAYFGKLPADFPGTTINLRINTNDTKSYKLKSEISVDDIF